MTERRTIPERGSLICPWCDREMNALAGDRSPRGGDKSICAYCLGGAIICYNESGIYLRKPINRREIDSLREALISLGIPKFDAEMISKKWS